MIAKPVPERLERLTLYLEAVGDASQLRTTCAVPAVAVRPLGADGGGVWAVAFATAEFALSPLPSIAVTT